VIQRYVVEALQKQIKAFEAESGVAIAMDPKTGAVLAMVSLPDFDPARFSTTKQDLMRNRILTDTYEPGSIFKPIVAAAALDSGLVGFNEKFDCENGFWVRYRIGEFGEHRYGLMSVKDILVNSSNVGMAKMGIKMGNRKLHDSLRRFGFSERTGIDLPGEETGLLRPLNQWSGWSVTRIPFGHEISVTGVQICRAYCILANGGYAVKPHIVRAALDIQGNIVEDYQPAYGTGYIIEPKVAEWIVQTALTDAVNDGTGTLAKVKGCQVWGKTGTANIALPRGGYDTRNYVSSFVGGAPAVDPKIVVLVSIRKPNRSLGKGYSGGRVAAPVVSEILHKTLTYWGMLEE
jgi:cell division protein FtsI/penicillin-binding protein 2